MDVLEREIITKANHQSLCVIYLDSFFFRKKRSEMISEKKKTELTNEQ